MPPNKNRDNSTNPPRPLVPTLASGRHVKSPITPRLAAHHLNATPPLVKSARTNTPSTVKSNTTKDDLVTPVKALINSNITPRSSSRKSRVDSQQSTPGGTPNGTPGSSRPTSMVDGTGSGRRPFGNSALGISTASGTRSRPGSIVAGGHGGPTSPPMATSTGYPRSPDVSRDNGPMFFRAKGIHSPEANMPAKKSPVFFYANGELDDVPSRSLNAPSPPLSAVSTRSHKSQFFHADGRVEANIPPIPPLPSPPALGPSPMPLQHPIFRPPSPDKNSIHLSYRKGASQIIRPDSRPKAISILPPTQLNPPRQRSTSGGAPTERSHKRTSSLSSIESGNSNYRPSLAALDTCGLTPLHVVTNANRSLNSTPPSSAYPAARLPSPVIEADDPMAAAQQLSVRPHQTSGSTVLSVPQSPTKAGPSWPTQTNSQLAESILNARVERKIQDLEISNSSLMAINRQLEKEVRRQNKELRRFRRLSRAGRFSSLSIAHPLSGVGEGEDMEEDAQAGALPGLSEEEEDLSSGADDDDDDSEDDASSVASGSLSPSTLAGKDARKLAKDSKRLQLDLQKHRDLLVDSQKMNQSLKRCMAWTEDMIREGRKALDYKVYVSDVQLGGRILEEEHDEDGSADRRRSEHKHSLLSAWIPGSLPALEQGDSISGLSVEEAGRKSWQSEEADSGIELESRSGRGSRIIGEEEVGLGLPPEVGLRDLDADLKVCETEERAPS